MTTLVREAMSRYAPTTNLYLLDDGRHVLITVPEQHMPVPRDLAVVIDRIRVDDYEAGPTVVYLADERGRVVDADGDPANGMTPLHVLDPGTDFEQALAYIAEQESTDA